MLCRRCAADARVTLFLPTATLLEVLADTHGEGSAEGAFDRMVCTGAIKPWPEVPGWWELAPGADPWRKVHRER